MAYKQKLGRPRNQYKIRRVNGFAPKGFTFHKFGEKEVIFKRKEKKTKKREDEKKE
jgi:hypothetical protein